MSEFMDYILTLIETFMFFYVIFRKPFRKRERADTVKCVVCLAASMLGDMTGWGEFRDLLPISPRGILFFMMMYFLFDVSLSEMIALSVAEWTMLTITEMAVKVCIHRMAGTIRVDLSSAIVILLLWTYYIVLGRRLDSRLFQLPVHMWGIVDVIMVLLTFMFGFFSLIIVKLLPSGKVVRFAEVMFIFGVGGVCILVVVLIYYFNKMEAYLLQTEYMSRQNELQKEYFMQLLEKEKKTRQFRHDIIDHLLAMQHLCNRSEYGQLADYLTDTLGDIQHISTDTYDVGNDIINVVLNHYLIPVRGQCRIEVKGYIADDLPVLQRDLCTVAANLIKNAVESALGTAQGEICVDMKQGEKYICFHIENNYKGEIVLDQKGMPKGCEENGRGLGLQNVVAIVQKYHGDHKISIDNNRFVVDVFLKI